MPGSSMAGAADEIWAKKIFGKKACIRQAFGVMSPLATGCGSVWLERSVRDAEAARSNRAIPTIKNGRVPVKLEPVFLCLQPGCNPCCLPPAPAMVEKDGLPFSQSCLAYPDPAQSGGPVAGCPCSSIPRAFPRADRRPGFCREHLAGWGPVRLRPGCGRKREKGQSCHSALAKAGRRTAAVA